MSAKFGFGTYRVSEHNVEHIEALKTAIEMGVDLIDTSTNYMDGSAERAIAKAMHYFSDEVVENIKIVSKVGYIQGRLLENIDEKKFTEIVKYAEHIYHCISEEFIKDQLTQTLSRLNRDKIECYLLHNPEYYLLDAITRGVSRVDMLDELYRRIFRAFVALEKEVKKGRISSYGISSNSFSLPITHIEFLPYKDLKSIAVNASEMAGNKIDSFSTIELPLNILEKDGLNCLEWAKENGLRTLVNRPLNANRENKIYRLATYDEPHDYYHHLNEILELCDHDKLKSIYNLIESLDNSKYKFEFIGDYDAFLFSQIIPHLQKSIGEIDSNIRDTLVNSINIFLLVYAKVVAYECSLTTRERLKDVFKDCKKRLQDCALEYLLNCDDVDYILVGMRKEKYVVEIMENNLLHIK